MSSLRLRLLSFGSALVLGSLALQAEAACTAGPPLPGVPEQTPSADFAVLPNGTAVHTKTGLVWKRCAEGQTWDGANCSGSAGLYSWSTALTRAASTDFAGATAWRLPNRKELESLVEFCGHSPTINQTVFPGTPHERFWTSTTYLAEVNRAWDVSFADGYVGASLKATTQEYVRLVRSITQADYPLPQTITFGPAPTVTLGGSGTLSVAASSGLPVTLSVLTPSICSLAGTTVTLSSIGLCTIAGNQGGNATFAAAPEATLDLAVGKLDQAISFGGVPVLSVGGTGTVSATATSGLAVTLSNNTPTICSLTGNSVKGLAIGTCTIAASQAGDASYNPAPVASQNISVSAAGSGGGQPPAAVPVVVLSLVKGWNLTGNGTDTPFNVDDFFGDSSQVESVWKWVRNGTAAGVKYPTWAFRTPAIADKGAALAAQYGYEHLATIQPGEGFWVSAVAPFAVTLPGAPLPAATLAPIGSAQPGQLALGSGWSLVTAGEDLSPVQLYNAIGGKGSGLITLWSWDALLGKWLFHAPELEAQGSKVQADYAAKRGFLDFSSSGRRLVPGSGFWIHRP